jgi:hypothetical protein
MASAVSLRNDLEAVYPVPTAADTMALVGETVLRKLTNGRSPLQRCNVQRLKHDDGVLNPVTHPSSLSAERYRGPMMKRNDAITARTFADSSAGIQESDVAKQVSACLVVDFAHYKSTPKVIARLAGASPQAAKNWLAGSHPPSLVSFLRLLPHSPSLRKLAAMESELSPDFQRELSALIQRHMR